MKKKQRTSTSKALPASLREIDQEARRLGVTRQAFIKVRMADSLLKNQ